MHHKISAYTDDMLFSLTNSSASLPNLICEFDIYGKLANLQVNFGKSKAMEVGVSPALLRTLQLNFKCKWMETALKYLGTYIPSNLSQVFELNFPPS